MAYQFIHVELYARSASKLSGTKRAKKGKVRESDGIHKNWSARDILAEALREPGAHDHVPTPQRPEALFGDLQALADDLDRSEPHKGQRKDTPILLAGVVSAPWPPGDDRSIEWRMDTLSYLKREHGDNLKVVVGHNDESNDHLHFYVCTPDFRPVKPFHAGHVARAEAVARGDDAKTQAKAYEAAMKGLQDRYFKEVAQSHGQARTGPKRRRLGRMEWMEEKRLLELHAEGVRDMKKVQAANVAKADELAQLEQKQKGQTAKIIDAAKQVDARAAEIKKAQEALQKKAETLSKKELELNEKESTLNRLSRQLGEQKTKLLDAFGLLPGAIQEKLASLFGVKKPEPVPALAPRPAVAPVLPQAGQLPALQKNRAPGPS